MAGKVCEILTVMALRGCGELGSGVQSFAGVLPDRLQHHQTRFPGFLFRLPYEALGEQRGQSIDRVRAALGKLLKATGHCLHGIERRAREDRQQFQKMLFAGLEQLVAPLDRCPQRLLSGGEIAGAAAERLQPAPEAVTQCLG